MVRGALHCNSMERVGRFKSRRDSCLSATQCGPARVGSQRPPRGCRLMVAICPVSHPAESALLLRLKRAVRVSMQEQYFAILAEHRPPAAHSRHGVIDLEFAENRIPTIRWHFLLDCFHTIRIEVVPTEREAVLVVLSRAAELHR